MHYDEPMFDREDLRMGWKSARARALARGVIAGFALLAAGAVAAHHRGYGAAGRPGEFDAYLLSWSWSPAFCAGRPGDPECHGPRPYGFVVHGLWPQREHGRIEYCRTRQRVPADLARSLGDLLPDRRLAFHEWRAHGSCSGLDPGSYFALLRRAATRFVVPPHLRAPAVARLLRPSQLAAEIERANPAFGARSLAVFCGHGTPPRFTELRLCLTRALEPRTCPAAVLAAACHAPLLEVLPLR